MDEFTRMFWKDFELFQSKSGCIYTQNKAQSVWKLIERYIPEPYKTKIIIAWDHHRISEGRKELDEVCNEFKKEHKK